jgi:cell division protein FtsQ
VSKTNTGSASATVLDEPSADFYRPAAGRDSDTRPSRPARPAADPEDDAGEPFLRSRRRVPVRRGLIPSWARTRWGMPLFAATVLIALGAIVALALAVRNFLERDPGFRIESAASIQTLSNSAGSPASPLAGAELTRADLLSVFGSDVGRNLFLVPLARRRAQLEQIPWVENATVMRLLPNQLRVAITERTPIAFVQVHGRIQLADANGVILNMAPLEMAARRYSFPVASGISPADPLSVRGARMHIYQRFIADLDSSGEHISSQLSEVDLSDPDDVRATVPSNGSDLLLHFGQEDFLARWRSYQAHIAVWQQQYPHLASIDLRYDHQVVLKMAGDPGAAPEANSSPKPAEAAPKTTHTATAEHGPKSHKPERPIHNPLLKAHEAPAKPHPGRGPA